MIGALDALRPGRRRVPGLAPGRARDRRNAHAAVRLRARRRPSSSGGRPPRSAPTGSSARPARCAPRASSSSTASSGTRAPPTANHCRPGGEVRVESVEHETLQLVVAASPPNPSKGPERVHRTDRSRRRRPDRADVRLRRDQGRTRVRARRHLPPRPAPARAEGAGPLLPDPGHRPDGEGRPAHDHAQRAAAGSDHEGQRAGAGERGRLLPDRRAEERDRAGRELHGRDLADLADDAALRARPAHRSTSCSRSATRSTRSSRASSTRRPRPGASRSRSSR